MGELYINDPKPVTLKNAGLGFFAFSIAKCGSTMMNKALEIINAEVGLEETNLPGKYFREGISPAVWGTYDVSKVLKEGMCHRGYRYLPDNVAGSPLLQRTRSILLLRDLRDAAVSHYFSKAYEHPTPGGTGEHAEAYRKAVERTRQTEIDKHVMSFAASCQRNWKKYMQYLPLESGLVRIYRYEDIIFRKADWLAEVYDFVGVSLPNGAIERACEKVDVFPEQERKNRRARQVTPGDHRAKLKPETIENLNDTYHDYLKDNGYI